MSSRRRLALLALVAIAAAVAVVVLQRALVGGEEVEHAFVRQLTGRNVTARVYDDLVQYENRLGTLTIPSRCGTGALGVAYISRWTLPSGLVMTSDVPNVHSHQGFLNSAEAGAIGAFGAMWAVGPPPWRLGAGATAAVTGLRLCGLPGVARASPPEITSSTYEQRVCLLRGCGIEVEQRFEFGAASVRVEAGVRFRELDRYIKEPEFGVVLNGEAGITAVRSPNTDCRAYTGLADPRRRTGRCADPNRRVTVLDGAYPIAIAEEGPDWRRLAEDARAWPRAGDAGCPGEIGRRLVDRYEFTAWNRDGGPYDSVAVLVKAWEGCVTPLDFSFGYRRPAGTTREYVFGLVIRRA